MIRSELVLGKILHLWTKIVIDLLCICNAS